MREERYPSVVAPMRRLVGGGGCTVDQPSNRAAGTSGALSKTRGASMSRMSTWGARTVFQGGFSLIPRARTREATTARMLTTRESFRRKEGRYRGTS